MPTWDLLALIGRLADRDGRRSAAEGAGRDGPAIATAVPAPAGAGLTPQTKE